MDGNEQIILKLRAALEREVSAAQMRAQHDNAQLNEISRINNELVNTQRELASLAESARQDAEKVKVSEVRYRRLFESAKDGILILDAVTCQIIDANPFMVELLGYTRDEFLGQELWKIGLLKDEEASAAAFRELQETGYIRYEDLPLETKGGQVRAVEFVSNVYAENGHQVIQCNIRDITQRKETDDTSARLAAIVESSQDAIISKTLDGIITTWNAGAQALYGYTAQEAIGRPVSFLASPDLLDEMQQLLAKIRRGELVRNYETVRLRKDGSRVDISLSISPVRDKQGNIIAASSIKRDISERRQAEAALRKNEAKFRTIFETALDAILLADDESRYVDANPAACTLLGVEHGQLMGRSVADFALPELQDATRAVWKDFLRDGQQSGVFEFQRPDGTQRQAEYRAVAGLLPGLHMSILRDITERIQAELSKQEAQCFLQSTLDALSSHIAVLDEAGKIIAVNQAWRQFSEENGGTAISCGVGTSYVAVCDEATGDWAEEAPTLVQGIREVMAGQREAFCLEYPCHSPQEERWFSVCVTRFAGEGPVRVVVAHEDITERKQAEAKVKQSHAQLAEAQQIAHLGSWELDLSNLEEINQNPLSWSDEVFCIFGYQPGQIEVSNENFLRAVHPDDRAAITSAVAEAAHGSKAYSIEHRIILPDGTERCVHEQSHIVSDASGKPLKMVGTVQDITERKQVEAKLRESEIRYRALAEAAPDDIFIINREGILQYINHHAAQKFGLPPEALIGKAQAEIFPPDIVALMQHSLGKVFASAEPLYEEAVLSFQNREVWQGTWLVPLKNAAGEVTGVMGVARDISAQKQAEATLRASEARYRSLFESNPQPMWVHDLETLGFLAVNDATIKHYGYSRDEFLAMTIKDIRLAEDIPALMASISKPLPPGGTQEICQLRKKDGTIIDVELSKHELNFGERPARLALAHDITARLRAEAALQQAHDELERRVTERTAELERANVALQVKDAEQQQIMATLTQSEERFRLLVESVHDYAILMLDATGHVMTWNAGAERMKGYRAEDIIGHDFACFYTAEDQQAGKPAQELRIAEAEGYLDDEGWRVRSDGSRFWATVVITALRDADGQLRGFAKVSRDITERKNVEAALHEAKGEAERANLAKSEFLSRMSHELRTPLNAILGFGQILNKQDLAPLAKESVGYILNGGRHLLDLINEVLDIARVEAGHLELSLEPIALDDIAPEVCALVRPLADERHIRLDENTAQLGRIYVLADRQRLKQALINLLSNAIKYNRDGGQVEVACSQSPGDRFAIAVRDTGPGIAPQDLPKLFTPFERLNAGASDIEGTGLGLVLSQRLVTAMGGTLSVTSTLGQGTIFTIELPQTTSPENLVVNVPEITPPLASGKKAEHVYKVLCIEDNPSNLRLMEAILADRPEVTLLTAMQGSVGLDLARQHEPDLILLDLNLPDIHGKEVLTRLQQSALTRDIPVVIISADATPHQIERLMDAGAVAYLTKPLDVGQFLATIDKFLQVTPASVTQPDNDKEVV